MKNGKLNGKVAVVTGASKGIGAGIAKHFAAEGAAVVVNYASSKTDADKVVVEIAKAGGKAVAVQGSVAKKADVEKLFSAAEKAFGKIDILVNNAGVVVIKSITEQTEADWDKVLSVNLKGVFLCCHRVVQEMIKQKRGAIVNIASIAAFHYTVPHVPYAASKAGVVALTRDVAYEVARFGVRVNAIAPGPIETPMMGTALTAQQKDAYARNIPLGRLGQPQDIGEAAVFLASDAASYITGATLPVSGGTDLRVTTS